MAARALAVILVVAGCHAPAPPPTPGCDPGSAGLGSARDRPLALVGERVSDRMDLFDVLPDLAAVGCVGLDENPDWIDEPYDLAATSDELYIVLGHADGNTMGTLIKIHLPDGARQAEIPIGAQPALLTLSPDGKTAYVALFRNLAHLDGPWTEGGAVAIVDTGSMQILQTVEICNAPLGVALDAARQKLWAACAGSDELALIDLSGGPAAAVLEQMVPLDDGMGNTGSQPAYLYLDGTHAFVTAQSSGEVWIFDQETAAFVKRIGFGNSAFPQRMAGVPGYPLLLVNVDYLEELVAIDTNALAVADTVTLTGVRAQGIAVTNDAHYALITDERNLKDQGRLVRVDLTGLGAGGAKLDGSAEAAVFPQAVILLQ